MFRNRATIVTAIVLLLAGGVAVAEAQQTTGRGFMSRQERNAASILRRRSFSGQTVRTAQASGGPLPMQDIIAPPEEVPAPPNVSSGIGQAVPTESYPALTLDQAPTTADAYPITPYQSSMFSTPAASVDNPFSLAPEEFAGCDASGCSGGCGAGPACDGGCGGGYCWIDTLSINLGVAAFKNPINSGESGSFGFQQGFNWGTPWVSSLLGMNSQLGFRATETDFNGADFTAEHRAQYFVTAGFFKRNCNGWQGGFVFDYLHDDWYTTIDLGQIRGELSYGVANGSSFGFWFATSVMTDDTTSIFGQSPVDQRWDTHDIYSLFYRVQSNQYRRGEWRLFVGMTGASDGIIGSDFNVPLAGTWSLQPEFTYLIPDEATGAGAHDQEAWNVAFNLVWYPGRAMGNRNSHLLPFFDVAGNGSMISRLK